jgi:hypothetical protein
LDEEPLFTPDELTHYRLGQLERRLAHDYLTKDAMNNRYVTRQELRDTATAHRSWWPIAIAACMMMIQVGTLVVTLVRR